MFSHVRGSDQVHEGGGGRVGVVVRQRLQKLKCLVDEIPSELFHISLSSQQIHRKIRYLRCLIVLQLQGKVLLNLKQ